MARDYERLRANNFYLAQLCRRLVSSKRLFNGAFFIQGEKAKMNASNGGNSTHVERLEHVRKSKGIRAARKLRDKLLLAVGARNHAVDGEKSVEIVSRS